MMTAPRYKTPRMPPLEKVKADQEAGMTPLQMAEAYGVAPSSVKTFIRRHRLAKKVYISYPPDEEIIAAIEAGESAFSMAQRFGLHRDTLWRRIYDRKLRERATLPPAVKPELVTLKPDHTKIVVTTEDGKKISLPRIPTIHGHYEARP